MSQPTTTEDYLQALRGHDWYYDYTEDHRVWEAGRNQRDALNDMRKRFDPTGEIWNQYAPADCKIKTK